MDILLSIGTVFFVILSILLVVVILLQADRGAGLGVLGGGGSQSAFGSSTGDVMTKITGVMVTLFMIGSLGLAVLESQRTAGLDEKLLKSKTETEGSLQPGTRTPPPEEREEKDKQKGL
jgi:preprotein translocase subunit SecG